MNRWQKKYLKAKIKLLEERRSQLRSSSTTRTATGALSGRRRKSKLFGLIYWGMGVPLCILWSIPFLIIGGVLCATIAFLWLGLPIVLIGGAPLSWLIHHRLK